LYVSLIDRISDRQDFEDGEDFDLDSKELSAYQ